MCVKILALSDAMVKHDTFLLLKHLRYYAEEWKQEPRPIPTFTEEEKAERTTRQDHLQGMYPTFSSLLRGSKHSGMCQRDGGLPEPENKIREYRMQMLTNSQQTSGGVQPRMAREDRMQGLYATFDRREIGGRLATGNQHLQAAKEET